MEAFAWLSAVMTLVVEKFCEFVLQILVLVGVKEIKPEAKAITVVLVTVIACFAFSLDVFPLLGVPLVFPWLGKVFTGLLIGAGADLYHLAKERVLVPKVKA
jgi:hypothetical protein